MVSLDFALRRIDVARKPRETRPNRKKCALGSKPESIRRQAPQLETKIGESPDISGLYLFPSETTFRSPNSLFFLPESWRRWLAGGFLTWQTLVNWGRIFTPTLAQKLDGRKQAPTFPSKVVRNKFFPTKKSGLKHCRPGPSGKHGSLLTAKRPGPPQRDAKPKTNTFGTAKPDGTPISHRSTIFFILFERFFLQQQSSVAKCRENQFIDKVYLCVPGKSAGGRFFSRKRGLGWEE